LDRSCDRRRAAKWTTRSFWAQTFKLSHYLVIRSLLFSVQIGRKAVIVNSMRWQLRVILRPSDHVHSAAALPSAPKVMPDKVCFDLHSSNSVTRFRPRVDAMNGHLMFHY
jgi:hypothetical protein